MINLTIPMDERILERASGEESREQAVKTLLDLSRKTKSGSGGRRWTRDELHER